MSLIALYVVFGISLVGVVVLSTLLCHARMRARPSRDLETPITPLSSLTQITEGEFSHRCHSGRDSRVKLGISEYMPVYPPRVLRTSYSI
jgi:hypothetical protein